MICKNNNRFFRLSMQELVPRWMYGMLEFCLSMRGEYSTRPKIINCIFFKVKETNGDWIKCSEENNRELNSCYDNCEFNPDCAAGCNRDFLTRQLECPCEVRVTL